MNSQSCATCRYAKTASIAGAAEWQGFCHFNPPTPMLLMTPGKPNLAGQPTQQASLQAIRAPVMADNWCAQFCRVKRANDKGD